MAFKNLQEAMSDPDFWGADTTDDDRIYGLRASDKTFAKEYADDNKAKSFVANLAKTRQAEQDRVGQEEQQRFQAAPPEAQQGMYAKMTGAVTGAVGRGMEMATTPYVGAARMLQGESPAAAFGPETFTASHPATANKAASVVVPQSPAEAALLAAGPLGKAAGAVRPALKGAGALKQMLGTGALAGAGEAAFGEGDSALGRAGMGAAKGAAGSGLANLIGRVSGMGARMGALGGEKRIADTEATRVLKAVEGVDPTLAIKGGKGASVRAGELFEKGGAETAKAAAIKGNLAKLDQAVPAVHTPDLVKTYSLLHREAQNQPGMLEALRSLQPATPQGGWTPSQAAQLVGLARKVMAADPKGHLRAEALDAMEAGIVKAIDKTAPGMGAEFAKARAGYAKTSAIQEMFQGAFQRKPKGFEYDPRAVQAAVENPELLKRLSPQEIEQLREAAMRMKGAPSGAMDWYPTPGNYVPFFSEAGMKGYALRKLTGAKQYVGKKPLSATGGQTTGLAALLGKLLPGPRENSE